MKPYYDQDGITIYHADCADVLPLVEPSTVALLVTDPPYGIGLDADYAAALPSVGFKGSPPPRSYARIEGDSEQFDPLPLLLFGRCVIFGANHFFGQLPSGGLIVWDKTGGGKTSTMLSDAEVAWSNVLSGVRVFHHMWLAIYRDSELNHRGLHPTQKPVALMRWILDKWTRPDDLILDPYMGSGPIAQACHEMGRRYIGVEIVERYCEIAAARLAQGVLAFADQVGEPG